VETAESDTQLLTHLTHGAVSTAHKSVRERERDRDRTQVRQQRYEARQGRGANREGSVSDKKNSLPVSFIVEAVDWAGATTAGEVASDDFGTPKIGWTKPLDGKHPTPARERRLCSHNRSMGRGQTAAAFSSSISSLQCLKLVTMNSALRSIYLTQKKKSEKV
jgi:hypothetical protein